jgi:hypothetical protein
MRAEIVKIPDGRYVFEDFMEDDGIEDRAYRIGHGGTPRSEEKSPGLRYEPRHSAIIL